MLSTRTATGTMELTPQDQKARIEHLEAENASLKALLRRLTESNSEMENRGASPHEDHMKLICKYNELSKRYRELRDRYDKCGLYLTRAQEKYKEAKRNVREWQVYLESRAAKDIRKTERHVEAEDPSDLAASNIQSLVSPCDFGEDIGKTPRPCMSNMPTLDTPKMVSRNPRMNASPKLAREQTSPLPLDNSVTVEISNQYRPTLAAPRISSSQTTEDDQTPCSALQSKIASDDEPQVISARSLKRKRPGSAQVMRPPPVIKQEPTSPDSPIRITSDIYSSSQHAGRHAPTRKETSDLDVLVEHTNTPRKFKREERVRRRVGSEEISRPAKRLLRTSSHSDGDFSWPVEEETHTEVEPFVDQPHDEDTSRFSSASNDRKARTKGSARIDEANALRPISVNTTAISRNRRVKSRQDGKRGDRKSVSKAAFVSEDGINEPDQADEAAKGSAPNTLAGHRLWTLLNSPSPNLQPLPKELTPGTTPIFRREPEKTSLAAKAAITTKPPTSPGSGTSARQHRVRHVDEPPPARPEDEPLRSRPLTSLGLDDFRIDPKFMGADFAFADTFRGRDRRRCLPGCTRPECCGNAFRKAAETGALQNHKTDAQVLEEFLGPHWSAMMGAYTADKRRDLLMQARAAALANQYGKHRHAFERRSTPPGFWRTDMPTTQEEEDDRTRSREMERQKVEERWREAMRGGGRWKFRDE